MKGEFLILLGLSLFQTINFSVAEHFGNCPSTDKASVKFLIDSDDCSIFYKCDNGVAVKYDCPSGLHFSSTINVCVYPQDANCNGIVDNGDDTQEEEIEEPVDENVDNNESETNDETNENDGLAAVGECPSEDGEFVTLLPHGSDCSKFYICDRGTPVLAECSGTLLFNPELLVCDYPENAGCGSGSGSSTGGESNPNVEEDGGDEVEDVPDTNQDNAETEYAPVGDCPAEDGEFVTLLPHGSDCSKFYICDRGTPVLAECSGTLLFNPELLVCDYPENAGCGSGSGSSSGGESSPNVEEDGADEVEDVPDTNQDNSETEYAPVGDCPAEDGEFVTLLPHGSDCSKFYICDRGTPVLAECSGTLLFNPELLVCDYPENAGCGNGSGSSSGGESNPNVEEDGADEAVDVPDTNQDNSETEYAPVGDCPAEDGEFVTLLPHGSDCSKFYICDRGTPVLAECSGTLLFNPDLLVCDYPENAGCGNGSGSSSGGESNPNVEEDGADEAVDVPDTNQDNSETEYAPVGDCPAEDGEFVTLLPHGSDCSKFYICDRGTPVLAECSGTLLFNPELLVCDYPENAGCGNGSGSSGGGESNPNVAEDGADEAADVPDTNQDNSETEYAPVGDCPAEDGEFVTLLPHGSDCSKFYICDRGTPVLAECSGILLFNPELLVCDYPENAGCESGSGSSSGGESNPNVEEDGADEVEDVPDTNQDNGETEYAPVGDCPAEDGEFVTLLPHGSDCSKFYICDRGTPVLAECYGDLLFNPELLVCDYAENAGCGSGSSGGETNSNVGDDVADKTEDVSEDNSGIESAPVGECPSEDGEFVTLLPHASDCSKFYICNEGIPVVAECPGILLFNPQLLVCDYPESAGCVSGSSESISVEEDVANETEEVAEDDQNNTETETDDNSWVGDCPEEDGEFVTLLPHQSDCTKFYICDRGTPVLTECYPGLYFNPTLSVCDYPENSECQNGSK